MRLTLIALLLALLSGPSFAKSEAESFCSMDIASSLEIMGEWHHERAKKPLLEAFRDEVLARLNVPLQGEPKDALKEATRLPYDTYFAFVKAYVAELEKKIDWKNGKLSLVKTMQSVIEAQEGDAETKKALVAQVDENSIVPLSTYIKTLEGANQKDRGFFQKFLPSACGGDALIPGGIATVINKRKVFVFCPGSLLAASISKQAGRLAWTNEVKTEALQFTAFHEFGHLLGADYSSRFRPLHDEAISCLKSQLGTFPEAYEDETLADLWGAVALVAALKETPNLTAEQKLSHIALNLSVLQDGSEGGPTHLRFAERKKVVLAEACRYLLDQKPAASDCRLKLYAH